MVQKILLTGATGFVGKQIVKFLCEFDVELYLVVRDKDALGSEFHQKVVKKIYTPDLFSKPSEWWEKKCEGIDIIVHAAWYTEPGLYLNSIKNTDCLIGSINLANGATKAGIKRFVGIGTCFEYDLTSGVISIETPIRPGSIYAGTKASLFFTLSNLFASKGIEFCWCRLFYLFGEGDDPRRLVGQIRTKLALREKVELTSGNQIRDYLDVSVAGEMIAETVLSNAIGPVNICSGIPITVRQLAEGVAAEFDGSDLLHFGVRPENPTDPKCVVGIKNA